MHNEQCNTSVVIPCFKSAAGSAAGLQEALVIGAGSTDATEARLAPSVGGRAGTLRRSELKLHLGCGAEVFDGWVNVDYALGAWLAKVPLFRVFNRKLKIFNLDWDPRIHLHDLTRKFPWQDESAGVVYSSHTLEHFSRKDGRHFLAECHRVLKKGGIIRIVVPDLGYIARQYLGGELPADQFLHALGVLYGMYGNNRLKNRLAFLFEFPHKCMYDAPTLQQILEEIGFQAASRGPFESDIHDIRQMELEHRTRHAVIVEGRKKQL